MITAERVSSKTGEHFLAASPDMTAEIHDMVAAADKLRSELPTGALTTAKGAYC